MEYNIIKIPEDKQDKTMDMRRYRVEMPNGTTFVCFRYNNHRTDHVYFTDDTQFAVDGDVLDSIEESILGLDLYEREIEL